MYICVVCLKCVSVCLLRVMFLILDRKVGPNLPGSLPPAQIRHTSSLSDISRTLFNPFHAVQISGSGFQGYPGRFSGFVPRLE